MGKLITFLLSGAPQTKKTKKKKKKPRRVAKLPLQCFSDGIKIEAGNTF